ncbi:MAG: T9SS type A sorting domain-containing protein [Ferruginibacter sp.]
MQENSTPKFGSFKLFLLTTFLLISITSNSLFAQSFCANETTLFTENFGTGSTPSSHPDVVPTSLLYQPLGELYNEGVYRVINNTQQKPDWHASPDHTVNTVNGKMLVVNGSGNGFYRRVINSPSGFSAGYYSVSLFIMNVNQINLCGPNILLPQITFIVEYQAQDNSWVALTGSPLSTTPVAYNATTPTWVQLGGVFTLPTTGVFNVQNIRLSLRDGISSGCGNDYAIDDIKLATCPSGGPLPVEFLSVSAKQRGAGIAINWNTATEVNNKYFDVEKSVDDGSNWSLVTTTKAGGNSSVVKTYNAYDAKPAAGINYYRIKQVDLDGKYKYSITVHVKMNFDKTSASVLTNPFVNNIAIDFLSKTTQGLALTLYDVAGKKITTERWIIPKGTSRKTFDQVNNIQKGIYILNIIDDKGVLIYNGKLVKQ